MSSFEHDATLSASARAGAAAMELKETPVSNICSIKYRRPVTRNFLGATTSSVPQLGRCQNFLEVGIEAAW